MTEKVKVRQNEQFETGFWAVDPNDAQSGEFQPVRHLYDLTPYGMLLASLGACTTIVLHTYAQHHGVDLEEVELALEYARVFQDDCENCEEIDEFKEQIQEQIRFSGDLTTAEHDKLLHIAHQCSIRKMLESGIGIVLSEAEDAGASRESRE